MISEIPEKLKHYPNWVVWGRLGADGKPSKTPIDPKTEQNAKANDPNTWTSFNHAVKVADILNGSEYQGIGFELHGTDIVGVDFDNVVNPKGVIDPYVLEILRLLDNPYTELSPSKRGLHAFFECDALPEGGRKMSQDHAGIEIYHGKELGRYFTISGDKILGDGIPKINAVDLPYILITQYRDKKFKALWLGDTALFKGDDSAADFALMCELAKITKGNTNLMEKYFSASWLARRDKWDRPDYRQSTIKKAVEKSVFTASGVKPTPAIEFHVSRVPDPDGEYVVAPAEHQEDGWFPLGDISLIGGASGTGKTTWIFEMLHHQKQGYPVLGHKTFGRNFQVLAYDRGRNAFTRTMRRLRLLPSDVPTTALPLAFGIEAVQTIINEIEKMSPIPNIIFIEGLDMLIDDANKKSVVSPFMRQLQEVAAYFHIALICSVGAPKTKRGEDYAAKRDKLSGSEAWGRNCETVCVLEFTEEDDGTAPQRSLTVLPRNASAEKFTLQFENGRLVPFTPTAEPEQSSGGRPPEKVQEAIQFLEQELQDNQPKVAKILIREAREFEGITESTLRRAAKILHVDTHQHAAGKSVWVLPEMSGVLTSVTPYDPGTADIDFGEENS
jgi:AAA domain